MTVNLNNHRLKITNKRTTMSILAFFGAVGGMQRFVAKYFGIIGGWFSGKFISAKLANDMYLMKKKKNKKK